MNVPTTSFNSELQRRRTQRFQVHVPAAISDGAAESSADVRNFSCQGLLLETQSVQANDWQPGHRLQVRLHLQHAEGYLDVHLQAQGRVLRSQQQAAVRQVAVEFDALSFVPQVWFANS